MAPDLTCNDLYKHLLLTHYPINIILSNQINELVDVILSNQMITEHFSLIELINYKFFFF